MDNRFFEKPILNSPYRYPARHWELDASGQPTQWIIEKRRRAEFITPIRKPRKRKGAAAQQQIIFDEGKGLSTEKQQYDPTPVINDLRCQVEEWRALKNQNHWRITPETARLLNHWRHHKFSHIRPFFCQVEAVETLIWLTEDAPNIGKAGKGFLDHLANANHDANPELMRLALKMATGAGKTAVMAMIIAWQTINAVHCVVSVSMLAEDWDANTVTHVLGVWAFGTQLLCEQVIGRALRQSYDLNEEELFSVEYADVLGIPFDFTAKPVVAPPQPPRETIQVRAVRPDRDPLEIRFPLGTFIIRNSPYISLDAGGRPCE